MKNQIRNTMIIRKAKVTDSKAIATYMMLAMDEIVFNFIGENSQEVATQFLAILINEKANQYSYENCWVMEDEHGTVAVANVYDGAKLNELRIPVANLIQSRFNKSFKPEDETQAGEFYIDCIGVDPNHQGKGIGSQILEFLKEEYTHKNAKTLGLLVDLDNPNAKRLYLKHGFESVGNKMLIGKEMEHLQYSGIEKVD